MCPIVWKRSRHSCIHAHTLLVVMNFKVRISLWGKKKKKTFEYHLYKIQEVKIMWKLKWLAISQTWRLMKADFAKEDNEKKIQITQKLGFTEWYLKEKKFCSNPAIICCNEYWTYRKYKNTGIFRQWIITALRRSRLLWTCRLLLMLGVTFLHFSVCFQITILSLKA